jgi:hypothetical protein
MNVLQLADEVEMWGRDLLALNMKGGVPVIEGARMLRTQEKLIQILNDRIERMLEKQSHYEAMEHAAGFEAGRQLGMKQEKALWELAASTQGIENERK